MDPRWNHARSIYMQSILNYACARADASLFQHAIEMTDQVLRPDLFGNTLTNYEKSFVVNVRAQAHHLLGEMSLAEKDYIESIRTEPQEPQWYLNRAQFLEQRQRPELAQSDRLKAEELRQTRSATGNR
jgi:hypothetical protein